MDVNVNVSSNLRDQGSPSAQEEEEEEEEELEEESPVLDLKGIEDYVKSKLFQLSKLFPTAAVIDQSRRLVVIRTYFQLLEQYRANPRIKCKAMKASEIACGGVDKNTQHFRRKIRADARFLLKNGFIPPYQRGNVLNHASLLDNELVLLKIHAYLAQLPIGEVTPRKFWAHLIDSILPSIEPVSLKAGRLSTKMISLRTAIRWLRRLGYSRHPVKKGVYIDGHERADVKEARDTFLKEIDQLQKYIHNKLLVLYLTKTTDLCVNTMKIHWNPFRLS